jgi:hypothetical protein
MRLAIVALSSNVHAVGDAPLMPQRLAAVRLIPCAVIGTQRQEGRGDSCGRSLAATLKLPYGNLDRPNTFGRTLI